MRRIITGLALLLFAVVLGACADGTAGQDGTPGPTAGPTTGAPSPSPPPASTPTPPMPTVSPPPGADLQTISGQVYEGVEANCRLIDDGGTDYLLLRAEGQFRAGETVTVRGYPDPDLSTICMQGTPFVVTEVVDD